VKTASLAYQFGSWDRVEIRGLGSFKVKSYDGYRGTNPKTGKQIKVKPKKLRPSVLGLLLGLTTCKTL
jgi:integration host factor subunit beta